MRKPLSFCLISYSVVGLLLLAGCSSSTPRPERAPGDVVSQEQEDESHDEKIARQEEILRRQEMEMQRQQREIDDLKRQKFYNKALKPYTKER